MIPLPVIVVTRYVRSDRGDKDAGPTTSRCYLQGRLFEPSRAISNRAAGFHWFATGISENWSLTPLIRTGAKTLPRFQWRLRSAPPGRIMAGVSEARTETMTGMGASDSFNDLMARLTAGDDEAAAAVFQRYAQRLIALAHSRLDEAARHKEDPEDVVQSVLRSFFTRHRGGQFHLADWDGLWSMLALITVRKCVNRIEYLRAECRDVT